MKYLILVMGLFAGLAQAVTISPSFSWKFPTEYADAAKTPMPVTDVLNVKIYDADTVIGVVQGNVTVSGPIPITFTNCAMHDFTATLTTVNGIESVRSAKKSIFLCQPGAPTLIFLP